LECAHLEDRRGELLAAVSGGVLEWSKYEELATKLTRVKEEVDEEAILKRGEELAARFAAGEFKKAKL